MANAALMFLYALCTLGAALNFPAWAMLFWTRFRNPNRIRPWWMDVYLLTRSGLTLLSFGVAGLAGLRLFAAIAGGPKLAVPDPIGLLFIGAMATAEPLFLRVDEVHARARGARSWTWRGYWIGVAAIAAWITARTIWAQ